MLPYGFTLIYAVNRKFVFSVTGPCHLSVLDCRMTNMNNSSRHNPEAKNARRISRDTRLRNRRQDKQSGRKTRRSHDSHRNPEALEG